MFCAPFACGEVTPTNPIPPPYPRPLRRRKRKCTTVSFELILHLSVCHHKPIDFSKNQVATVQKYAMTYLQLETCTETNRKEAQVHRKLKGKYVPTARDVSVFTCVCLSTIGLMAPRSLLGLVTARSVRILLECFLVAIFFVMRIHAKSC